MKDKFQFFVLLLVLSALNSLTAQGAESQRVVGGDISLVPAYEQAGDQWLDANGMVINDFVDFAANTCGWNAMRVRLFVEPGNDNDPATCQDIEYVTALGKRIKDAGMKFLVDLHYSDTWADVSKQALPASWNMDGNTSVNDLADKVYTYTRQALQALIDGGATPDFVQVGNEVSYGMLWDNCTYNGLTVSMNGKSNACYPALAYDTYSVQWTRFATLLSHGAKAVRELCPDAKIVLHSERVDNATTTRNFYQYVERAGFADYDIIGLSYYPIWHGSLEKLQSALNILVSNFPNKEIQIVETGYYNTSDCAQSTDKDFSDTWAYSPAGQAAFITDLIATLNDYDNVTGLYYWQPEECGNGSDGTTNRVMANWDGRGFWHLDWLSGQHSLISNDALMALQTYVGNSSQNDDPIDASSYFSNLDFEQCTDAAGLVGWTPSWELGITDGPWFKTVESWDSPLVDGKRMHLYNQAGNTTTAGDVIKQTATVPNGTYTISVVAHSELSVAYLFANEERTAIPVVTKWANANTVTVETEVTDGSLTIGIALDAINSESEYNFYADNFKVTMVSGLNGVNADDNDNLLPDTPVDVYDINGRLLRRAVPYAHCLNGLQPGIYIAAGKKLVKL
ncbi:MAG: glycosyl hydrolase 53 family protein [Muribaculaceae bacterium]